MDFYTSVAFLGELRNEWSCGRLLTSDPFHFVGRGLSQRTENHSVTSGEPNFSLTPHSYPEGIQGERGVKSRTGTWGER